MPVVSKSLNHFGDGPRHLPLPVRVVKRPWQSQNKLEGEHEFTELLDMYAMSIIQHRQQECDAGRCPKQLHIYKELTPRSPCQRCAESHIQSPVSVEGLRTT